MNSSVKFLNWYKQMNLCDFVLDFDDHKEDLNEDLNVLNISEEQLGEKKFTKEFQHKIINELTELDKAASYDDLANKIDNAKNLEELRSLVLRFDGCELKNSTKNTVFGDGNVNAKILAIGEAPGAEEDIQGIPFCGQSGKLLDKMFASINLYREKNLYITNTVFWRPPNNRRPSKLELEICLPFVEKHIALINPKLIILVGATAVESLLGITDPMTRIRQKYFNYKNKYIKNFIPATPIFHPAYLLRQQSKKALAWEDLQLIRDKIETL